MIWRHQMIAEKYLGGVYKKKMTPPEAPEKSYGPYKFKLVQLISQLLMKFLPLSHFYCQEPIFTFNLSGSEAKSAKNWGQESPH